jgi:hypothetical protein
MGARHNRRAEGVTLVENISTLTGVRRFAAAHTALAGTLDFTGCSELEFIECFGADVQDVILTGCTSLVRLCLENCNLRTLDLNPVRATLRDLRAANQQGGRITLTPLTSPLAWLYHFCVRDQVVVGHPSAAQLPVVQERWDWNTRQSGALRSASGAIRSLLTAGNQYTSADLTDQFPEGCKGTLNAAKNNLTSVTLTGCSGLSAIDLSSNRLGIAAVDDVLALVASWNTSGGTLNLSGNSAPSFHGVATCAELRERGWEVTIA